jgi:hypothetical protein
MNAWDFVTWLSSVVLGLSAVVIFVFFLRDARSILNREMHGHDEEPENSSASRSAAGGAPAPPGDAPR